ncbi:hypothetical protein HDV01_000562 [Terramyces sp. JEL0728]|nr:hypothetical protein HDV01_000562 [Terramyces sp. JEL0728]
MEKAHAKLNLTDEQFDQIKKIIKLSMEFYRINSSLIAQALGSVENYREDILAKKQCIISGIYRRLSSAKAQPATRKYSDCSLFTAIGGEPALNETVITLYDLFMHDAMLSPYFAKTEKIKLIAMHKKFLSLILSEMPISKATHASMIKAHMKMELDDKDFNRVKYLLAHAMLSIGVEAYLVEKVLFETEKVRDLILCRNPTILELTGEQKGVERLVKLLIEFLLDNDTLEPYFQDLDMKKWQRMFQLYLALIFSGEEIPIGIKVNMMKAHKKLNINDQVFGIFKQGIESALKNCSIPQYLIVRAMAAVENSKELVIPPSSAASPNKV